MTAAQDNRDQFEAWYIGMARKQNSVLSAWTDDEVRDALMARRPDDQEKYGSYGVPGAQSAWEAWQASRDALSAEPVEVLYEPVDLTNTDVARIYREHSGASRYDRHMREFAQKISDFRDDQWRLAAAPQPAAQERKPLSEDELFQALHSLSVEPPKRLPPGWTAFARAVERAHGITGE